MRLRSIPLLLLIATGTAAAQQAAPPHAPDGGVRQRIQSITILPTPNAPFTATVRTEWVRQLPDGTTSTLYNHRIVARDSAGHIFEERRFFSPHGDTEETRLLNLQFFDPARHEFYDCHPERKVCVVYPYYAPETVTPAAANPLPAHLGTTTVEDLGRKTDEGLELLGSRQITTLNAGVFGNTTPQPIVKEFWFSPHLEINVEAKRFDPRSGQLNFHVTDIDLTEPNPRLLNPPADYQAVQAAPFSMPAFARP